MPCVAVNHGATLLLWVRHHEYAAAVWFLSRRYSTTYGLPLMRLGYVAQLNGDVAIWEQ